MKKSKDKKPVLTCKVVVSGLSPESRKLIVECQQYEQEAVNRIWSWWLHDSLEAGKDADLRMFLGFYRRWKDAGEVGERPKLEFYAVEKDFQKRIMQSLCEALPCYNNRCLTLTCQRVIGNIKNNASHIGKLKLWQAVLLGKERLCASEGSISVPFDTSNGTLSLEDGIIHLTVRIDRFEVAGKVNASSHPIKMQLMTQRMSSRLKLLLSQAAQGLRLWKGSKLRYDAKKRRFFACITVECDPATAKVAGDGTARLTAPVEDHLWRLDVGDRTVTIGSGRSVAYLRKRLHREREVRERPTFPGNRRFGHSRKRYLRGNDRLAGLWQNKTKTWNGQAVARIIKEVEAAGVAVLEIEKPTEKSLINTAGGDVGPLWPTYQFCEFLARKASERGIKTRFFDGITAASSTDAKGCEECVA